MELSNSYTSSSGFTKSTNTLDFTNFVDINNNSFAANRVIGVWQTSTGKRFYDTGVNTSLGYISGNVLTVTDSSFSAVNLNDISVDYENSFADKFELKTLDVTSTSNSTVFNIVGGKATGAVTITGLTASGATLQLKASDNNGTTWANINGQIGGTGVLQSVFTTDGQFRVNIGSRTKIQLVPTITGTGTITISFNQSTASSAVYISSPLPNGTNKIGTFATDQTTHGTTDLVAADITKVNGSAISLGQKTSINSFPAVIASDQVVPVSASALPLPTGAATSTKQSDGSQKTQIVDSTNTNTLSIGTLGNILVSGYSPVGQTSSLNPVSVSGVDSSGLKRNILTKTDGTVKSENTIIGADGNTITSTTIGAKERLDVVLGSGVIPNTTAPNWMDVDGGVDPNGLAQPLQLDSNKRLLGSSQVQFPQILSYPQQNYLSSTGTVQYGIVPNGLYSFCISIDNATLGATANTIASCNTTAYTYVNYSAATTITTTTNIATLQVGQLLAGTGIAVGTYVTSVTNGTGFKISQPATASGNVTINATAGFFAGTFQSSPDGTTWNNVSATPLNYQIASASSSSFISVGLWKYQAGNTDKFLRFNLTSIGLTGVAGNLTSLRLRFNIDPLDRLGAKINLPYVSYIAATASTFPTGIPVIYPINTEYLSEIIFDNSALSGTSQSITFRTSADDTGILFNSISALQVGGILQTYAITTGTTGTYRIAPNNKYFYASMTNGTAITANTITGCSATVGYQPTINPFGNIVKTTQPTARTDGQLVTGLADKVGRVIVKFGHVRDLTTLSPQVTITTTTETTIAAVASTFNDLQTLEIASTANFSGTPTGARLDFRDTTAGTVRFSVSFPALGGTFNFNRSWMGSELKQTTVNTNWTVQLVFIGGTSPAISNGDIRVTAQIVGNI
jgi:hypothetical protein